VRFWREAGGIWQPAGGVSTAERAGLHSGCFAAPLRGKLYAIQSPIERRSCLRLGRSPTV